MNEQNTELNLSKNNQQVLTNKQVVTSL